MKQDFFDTKHDFGYSRTAHGFIRVRFLSKCLRNLMAFAAEIDVAVCIAVRTIKAIMKSEKTIMKKILITILSYILTPCKSQQKI